MQGEWSNMPASRRGMVDLIHLILSAPRGRGPMNELRHIYYRAIGVAAVITMLAVPSQNRANSPSTAETCDLSAMLVAARSVG